MSDHETRARAALRSVAERLAHSPELRQRSAPWSHGAKVALALAQVARQPDLAARLSTLSSTEVQADLVDRLEEVGWACYGLAIDETKDRAENKSDARVPRATYDEALRVRREMMDVLAFAVAAAEVEAELADIRRGSGYEDLAVDLVRLAELWGNNASTLREEVPRRFDEALPRRASELAEVVFVALSGSGPHSVDATPGRIWAHLRKHADLLSAALQLLFVRTPERRVELPTFALQRGGKSRRPGGGGDLDLDADPILNPGP